MPQARLDRVRVTLVAAASLVVLLAVPAGAAHKNGLPHTCAVDDTTPGPGQVVVLSGTGWGAPVQIFYGGGPNVAPVRIATGTPDASGSFTTTGMIPANAALGQTSLVFKESGTPGAAVCKIPFRVEPAIDADLSLTKADSPDPVGVLRTLTYTDVIFNFGPLTAKAVALTQNVPANASMFLILGAVTTTQGTCTEPDSTLLGGTVNCALGDIPSGGSVTVKITVTPLLPGSATSTGAVSSTSVPPTPDENPANNTATATTTVTLP